ncbi:MAG: hypothetical protein EA369_09455 [Bradymonadales bacterium]|nr:MAG: hypothetical protein EA369_09455 [Bradymonadales bacterium]
MTKARAFSEELKVKFNQVSSKLVSLERQAERQIRSVVEKTDQARRQQMKRVNEVLKEAQKFRSISIVNQAGRLQKDLEKMAGQRIQILLKRLHLPSKHEIDRLQKKIDHLEKRLQATESKKSVARKTGRRRNASPAKKS